MAFLTSLKRAFDELQKRNVSELEALLLGAAPKVDLDVARQLIREGADIECPDERGRTMLVRALLKARLPVADLLVDCGANVNAKSKGGLCPIHSALVLCTGHSADPNPKRWFRDNASRTRLLTGFNSSDMRFELHDRSDKFVPTIHASLQFVRKILSRGADPFARLAWNPSADGLSWSVSEKRPDFWHILKDNAAIRGKEATFRRAHIAYYCDPLMDFADMSMDGHGSARLKPLLSVISDFILGPGAIGGVRGLYKNEMRSLSLALKGRDKYNHGQAMVAQSRVTVGF